MKRKTPRPVRHSDREISSGHLEKSGSANKENWRFPFNNRKLAHPRELVEMATLDLLRHSHALHL